VQFCEMKQDERSNSENTVSLVVGGKTLYLFHLYDPDNPIELAFQSRYGSIVSYKWFGDGYILIGFGAHTDVARLGALSYEVAHGLFKALLFLTIGEAAARAGGSDLKTLIKNKQDIPRGTRIALIIGVLGIIGLPPLAGFDAKAILENGLPTTLLRLIVLLVSIGTVVSFAKLTPVLFSSSTCRTNRSRILAYTWLGGGIILFWPLSLFLVSPAISQHAVNGPHIAQALAVIAVGGGLYFLIRKKQFRLPSEIFRLETSPVIILLGFFLVYALIAWG